MFKVFNLSCAVKRNCIVANSTANERFKTLDLNLPFSFVAKIDDVSTETRPIEF